MRRRHEIHEFMTQHYLHALPEWLQAAYHQDPLVQRIVDGRFYRGGSREDLLEDLAISLLAHRYKIKADLIERILPLDTVGRQR